MAKHVFFIFLFTLSGMVQNAHAQLYKRTKAKPNEKAPQCVLVELFSGYNRIERVKDEQMQMEISRAMLQFNKKVLLDFEDNFKYCPVFYFYDSNIIAIQKGDFEGKLLNAEGKPIDTAPVLAEGDTNYFILYFGILVPTEATPYDEHVAKKMLVALDHNGDLLPPPLPRTPGASSFKNIKSKKFNFYYKYTNKVTDTYYRACAMRYSRLLEKYYGKKSNKKK